MSPENFNQKARQVQRLLQHDIYTIVGVEAVKQTHQAFEQEGFTDDVLEPWPDLSAQRKAQKRKGNGSIAKILHETGNLEDSIDYEAQPAAKQTVVHTDVPYAQRHNEGSHGMPKRQFMGPSKQLDKRIVGKLERELDRIFKG